MLYQYQVSYSCIIFYHPVLWLHLGMKFLLCKCRGSYKILNATYILKMWVSWDEFIFWEIYKIMFMIYPSQICLSSNFIAYQFLKFLTCAILMKVQIEFFLLVSFLSDSFLNFSKHPNYHNSLFHLVSFALNDNVGVMIPCCAPYTPMQFFYFVHKS
jgi:hypothetical protein